MNDDYYVVVNDWDNSDAYQGTYEECEEYVADMARFTTQSFTIVEFEERYPDDDYDDEEAE